MSARLPLLLRQLGHQQLTRGPACRLRELCSSSSSSGGGDPKGVRGRGLQDGQAFSIPGTGSTEASGTISIVRRPWQQTYPCLHLWDLESGEVIRLDVTCRKKLYKSHHPCSSEKMWPQVPRKHSDFYMMEWLNACDLKGHLGKYCDFWLSSI